jgi:hypothetical protein
LADEAPKGGPLPEAVARFTMARVCGRSMPGPSEVHRKSMAAPGLAGQTAVGVAEQAWCVTGEYRVKETVKSASRLFAVRGSGQECPRSAWTEKVSRVRQTRW